MFKRNNKTSEPATEPKAAKKPRALSFYEDLINSARICCGKFRDVARRGRRHGWKEPGPAAWELPEAVKLIENMTMEITAEDLLVAIAEAEKEFAETLVDGFRKGNPYRQTNKKALTALRATYSTVMKPILIRLDEERKMEERVQRKIATAAKQREKRLGNKG